LVHPVLFSLFCDTYGTIFNLSYCEVPITSSAFYCASHTLAIYQLSVASIANLLSFTGGFATLALTVDKLTVAFLTELFTFFKPPLFLLVILFLHDHLINDLVLLATHGALCLVFACPVNLVDHCAGIASPLVFIDLNLRRFWLRLVLGL
jgi:hypothetical protein